MNYSIIYEFDCPSSSPVHLYQPPNVKKWQLTENNYEDKLKHRKYVTILNQEQFDEFVDSCGLYCEKVHTMGSLGAPGFGFGWANAVSFNSHDSSIYQNAYVTPFGNRREVAEFLRKNKQKVPQILLDDEKQKYLFVPLSDDEESLIEAEESLVWDAVEQAMWKGYGCN